MQDDLLDEGLLRTAAPEWDAKTITRINDIKLEINEHLKKMQQGRVLLWLLVVFSILGIILSSYFNLVDASPAEIAVEGTILAVIYAGAALLFKRYPTAALSVGLGIYVLYQILTAFVLPESLFRGIIIKGIVLFGLGRAIASSTEIKSLAQRLRKYGVPREEVDTMLTTLEPIRKTPRPVRLPEQDGQTPGQPASPAV